MAAQRTILAVDSPERIEILAATCRNARPLRVKLT
jgi:hypothetical protein